MAEIKKINITDLQNVDITKSDKPKGNKNNGEEEPEGKLWFVPAVVGAVAVVLVLIFMFAGNLGNLFSGSNKYEKHFSSISTTQVVDRMEANKTFMVLVYAEACPHCRGFVYGDEDARRGKGVITTYSKETDIEFKATWANDGTDFNEIIGDWFLDLEDKLTAKGLDSDFKWRNNMFAPDANGTVNRSTSDYSSSNRPPVPTLMFFKDGVLKGGLEGNVKRSTLLSFVNSMNSN